MRDQADPVEQCEERREQGPERAGSGGRRLGVVLAVRGGRHRYDEAVRPVDRFAQRGLPGGDGDDRAAAPVGLFGEQGEARFGAVCRDDQQQVDGAGPAGERPAQGARGRCDARGVDTGDGCGGSRERADQIGDAGCGGAGARDQDGPWAALRGQLGDPGLRRVPGGGTDARPGLGGAAEQTAAVGSGQGFRGVEQRLVEHGDGPPITC